MCGTPFRHWESVSRILIGVVGRGIDATSANFVAAYALGGSDRNREARTHGLRRPDEYSASGRRTGGRDTLTGK